MGVVSSSFLFKAGFAGFFKKSQDRIADFPEKPGFLQYLTLQFNCNFTDRL